MPHKPRPIFDGHLITIEQAIAHLRLDIDNPNASPPTDDRVPDLLLKMAQAEGVVIDYLKLDDEALDLALDGMPDASPPVDPTWNDHSISVVQAAVLLVLSALYDDEIERTLGDYMGPQGVITRLLMRLRDPAFA